MENLSFLNLFLLTLLFTTIGVICGVKAHQLEKSENDDSHRILVNIILRFGCIVCIMIAAIIAWKLKIF